VNTPRDRTHSLWRLMRLSNKAEEREDSLL
jgi:hypothetical protein